MPAAPTEDDPRRGSGRRPARPTPWASTAIWVWDHFYPLYGDPDGRALRGLHAAGRAWRSTPSRPPRRAGDVQLLPQPEPAGRHGPHHRPPVPRPLRPRHRLGLVRARLRRVRLRVRHRHRPPARPRARPPDHQGPAGEAAPRPGRPAADPDRRLRARRSRCGWSPSTPTRGTASVRPRTSRARTRCSTSGARRSAATRRRSSAPWRSTPARPTGSPEYAEAGADHLIVMPGPPFTMDALRPRSTPEAEARAPRRFAGPATSPPTLRRVLDDITTWVTNVVDTLGYVGVAFLVALGERLPAHPLRGRAPPRRVRRRPGRRQPRRHDRRGRPSGRWSVPGSSTASPRRSGRCGCAPCRAPRAVVRGAGTPLDRSEAWFDRRADAAVPHRAVRTAHPLGRVGPRRLPAHGDRALQRADGPWAAPCGTRR